MWNIIAPNKISGTIWEEIDDAKVKVDKEYLEANYPKP